MGMKGAGLSSKRVYTILNNKNHRKSAHFLLFTIFFTGCRFETELDATRQCVVPGLVDAHTHPVWEGDRVHEFAMKVDSYYYNLLLFQPNLYFELCSFYL